MSYYKNRTLVFKNSYIAEGYTVAGPKENDGRYKGCFDLSLSDDMFGEKTFEKAERKMFEHAINGAIAKANLTIDHIDAVFGGDLLNQIVSCAFAMRNVHSGFFGLYNACATFVESLILGAGMLNNGLENVLCVSGSHFSTAERQYRYPLELGVLRSPVTQWTATGVGCSVLTSRPQSECPKILKATVGRVVDYGIMDTNNMGAAMAPAAVDTFETFLHDTKSKASDYDIVITGDLGKLGGDIFMDLLGRKGIDISGRYLDCGASLYFDSQQTYQGGSGAACSALVFNSEILNNLNRGKYKKAVLIGTGALMSPTTSFQGESIPAIAHLVQIDRR